MVLGYHQFGADGSHLLSPICVAGVERATDLAVCGQAMTVLFTGWSSRAGHPSEADQMIDLWKGPPDISLIREPHAANTAENATRSLALIRELPAIREIIVVCSVRHMIRVPFFFRALYRAAGLRVRYSIVWCPFPPAQIWAEELRGIVRMMRDRRRATEPSLPDVPVE